MLTSTEMTGLESALCQTVAQVREVCYRAPRRDSISAGQLFSLQQEDIPTPTQVRRRWLADHLPMQAAPDAKGDQA
jgi:hypothetical protein